MKGVPLHQTKHTPKMLHYKHTYDYTHYDCHNPMFNIFVTHIFTSLRVIDIALVIDILFSVDQAALLCTAVAYPGIILGGGLNPQTTPLGMPVVHSE
jgi:hypothetical protein